jgi:hypothetical protein
MIKIGFSTSPKNIISKVIRWFTKSKASHTWVLFEDTFFGMEMVMESTDTGFRVVPFANFKAEGNEIVALVVPTAPLDDGVKAAASWLGESYDFGGLFGSAFVLLGRWLRRKWANPWASCKSMFCSEAVARILQAAKYPGSSVFVPEATTPQDLLDFFAAAGVADAKLARAKRLDKGTPAP